MSEAVKKQKPPRSRYRGRWQAKVTRRRGGATFECPRCRKGTPTRVMRTTREADGVVRERLCTACGWTGQTVEKNT